MAVRPTQTSIFSLVNRGLAMNLTTLANAQERVSTGKAILRPSDDAVGTNRAMSMRRRLGQLERFQASVQTSRPVLETSTAALEEASGVLSEARSLIVQSLNGSLSNTDRQSIAQQLDLIVEQLVDVANTKIGDRFVFAGTRTDVEPFSLGYRGDDAFVQYLGNDAIQSVSVGFGTELKLNVPGSEVFGARELLGVELSGLTGVALGTTANQGSDYAELVLRHDATLGTPGSGIALATAGSQDTILNDHALVVDAAAGTVTLDGGAPQFLPSPGDADYTNFAVTNENGAVVHLDFTGYTGASSTSTLTGEGSISLNGGAFTSIAFTETDLELIDPDTDTVLHVDTTAIDRAGDELVSFTGATDIFSALAGIASDLRNGDDRPASEVIGRVNLRFEELQENFDQVLGALGTLGSRTERLLDTGTRLETMSVNVEGLLTQVEDADITEVILEMNQAEQTLQLAQATGSRLIQRSLLDFLR